jgi:hypothetical protein
MKSGNSEAEKISHLTVSGSGHQHPSNLLTFSGCCVVEVEDSLFADRYSFYESI